jgi:hypothetical protein
VLDRATVGAEKATREIQRAESATATANPGDVVATQSVADAIDRTLSRTVTTNAKGEVVIRPGKETLHAAGQYYKAFMEDQGPNITVEKAAMFKRDFQEMANAAKQYMADDPTKAKGYIAKKAGAAMRRELLAVNPDLASIWREYGFWEGLRSVLQATTERTRPQMNWGRKMIAATVATAGGGASVMAHAGTIESAIGTSLAGGLALAIQSPTWKLASAQLKSQLASALVNKNPGAVKFTLARMAAVGTQAARPSVATSPVTSPSR